MNQPLFSGVCTAMVTPFLDGKINFPILGVLLQRQVDAGIGAVVMAGTTGESATLSDDETVELIKYTKSYVGNRILVIAGTGANSTEHAIRKSLAAQEAGADALLIVSPYYNKATPDGLIAHYTEIASCVHIPMILYNVPSRTGLDMPVAVYQQLAEIPKIVGVKEATSDIMKILKIRACCPEHFHIWSGNDEMTVPIISLGGKGVISVISNLFPDEMSLLTDAALGGDFDTAAAIQSKLLPWTEYLSCEVNPIPVKAAMAEIGYDCGIGRLPLTDLSARGRKLLKTLLS